MKPIRYKSVRALNYCTKCWHRQDIDLMCIDKRTNKLICFSCVDKEIELLEYAEKANKKTTF